MSPFCYMRMILLLLLQLLRHFKDFFNIVEVELTKLDMKINPIKSHCIRIGPRHNFKCADIITADGQWRNYGRQWRQPHPGASPEAAPRNQALYFFGEYTLLSESDHKLHPNA